jgi:hypothetical protein
MKKMKKNLFKVVIIATLIIVAITVLLIKVIPSHQERVASILKTRNDSIIMTKYLTGKYPELKSVAYEAAEYFRRYSLEHQSAAILCIRILCQEKIDKKILVDKLIDAMEYSYAYSAPENDEKYQEWKIVIKKIEEELSPSLLKDVRDSALNQSCDPILKSYYSSPAKVTKELLSFNKIDDNFFYHKIMTYSVLIDRDRQAELLSLVPDEILASYYVHSMNNHVSYARRLKLAKLASFFYLDNYELKNNDEDVVFFNKIKKLSNHEILEFCNDPSMIEFFIFDGKVEKELKQRTTDNLVLGFNKNNEKVAWNYAFPYTKYGLIIISSVRSKNDFEDALNFFLTVTNKGEEEKMLNILTASKSSLL